MGSFRASFALFANMNSWKLMKTDARAPAGPWTDWDASMATETASVMDWNAGCRRRQQSQAAAFGQLQPVPGSCSFSLLPSSRRLRKGYGFLCCMHHPEISRMVPWRIFLRHPLCFNTIIVMFCPTVECTEVMICGKVFAQAQMHNAWLQSIR